MTKEIINKLSVFDQDDWNAFIEQVSFGQSSNPSLENVADNFPARLFWVYNWFMEIHQDKVGMIVQAVIVNLATIEPRETTKHIINSLIYFIHEVRPVKHRKDVLLLIRDKRFSNLYYGSDNLQIMLIKAYVPLESKQSFEAEEYILNTRFLKDDYYGIYLKLYYYAYLGRKEEALELLSSFLTADQRSEGNYYEVMENSFIDVLPEYIQFGEFLKYLVENKISVEHNQYLDKTLKFIIDFLKREISPELLGQILFLEDYFTSTETNSNFFVRVFENLMKIGKSFGPLIYAYYYGDRDFNLGLGRSPDDALEATLATFDNISRWTI